MNNMRTNIIVKNNLQKYRKSLTNLTQKQLADILKVSIHVIVQIENKQKYPKYQVRQRICEYFNVSQGQMFYVEDDKHESE